jgi:hypothetical protein
LDQRIAAVDQLGRPPRHELRHRRSSLRDFRNAFE